MIGLKEAGYGEQVRKQSKELFEGEKEMKKDKN